MPYMDGTLRCPHCRKLGLVILREPVGGGGTPYRCPHCNEAGTASDLGPATSRTRGRGTRPGA